jgi:hypothetical protein
MRLGRAIFFRHPDVQRSNLSPARASLTTRAPTARHPAPRPFPPARKPLSGSVPPGGTAARFRRPDISCSRINIFQSKKSDQIIPSGRTLL